MKRASRLLAFGIASVIAVAAAHGYDRDAAREYAIRYSAVVNNNPVVNSTIYKNYAGAGGNCANFGSQCLIAGGIRFRAPEANNTAPDGKAEFETGRWTRAIKAAGASERLYSRVFSGVHNLYNSTRHARHGGVDRNSDADKADQGAIWTDARSVRPGDLVLDLYDTTAGLSTFPKVWP